MKNLFFVLIAMLITSLSSFAPATVIDSEFEQDVASTFQNPCNGDIFNFAGHELYRFHTVINENRVNLSQHRKADYEATDANGGTYSGRTNYNEHFSLPLTNGSATGTLVYRIHFVSHGSAPSFTLIQKGHFTVNANGDVTVSTFENTVDCN